VTAAAADEKQAYPQQERMKACNTQAADKNGDERKAFMSQCLNGGGATMLLTQQEKMKKCNADALSQGSQERRPQGVHERVSQDREEEVGY
jgi:hypothetical protein